MKKALPYFLFIKNTGLLLIFFLYSFSYPSQNRKTDSLLKLVNSTSDTSKAKNLILLCKQYLLIGDIDEGFKYAASLEELAKSNSFTKSKKDYFLAYAYQNYGSLYSAKSDYDKALAYQKQALEIRERIKDKGGIANSSNNIGNIFWYRSDYETALTYYLKALAIREETKDIRGMAVSYGNIGLIYKIQGELDQALANYLMSLKYRKEINDKEGIAAVYTSISNVIKVKGQNAHNKKDQTELFNKSMEYSMESLKISKEIDDKLQMALCYGNIGNIHEDRAFISDVDSVKFSLLKTALEYYFKELEISEQIKNKRTVGSSCINLGHAFLAIGKNKDAFIYLERALKINEEIGNTTGIGDAFGSLAEYYSNINDFKNAYYCYKKAITIKDSIRGEQNKKDLDNINSRYITEKKDKEILLLNKDKEKQEIINRHKNTILIFVSIGLAVMLVLAFLAFRSYRQKKEANLIITAQKEDAEKKTQLIEEQKHLVDEKNKDIVDSINYAKKIQEAILPAKEVKYSIFPNGFVLFKPRDIVSGDFYWFTIKNNKRIISAVDCTGHGVPGAFMSMIGNTFLNEIIEERGITTPSEILSELRHSIIKSLKQSAEESESRDGMDMALITIDDENKVLEFAGANNPIWIFRDGVCTEYIADKRPIGYYRGQGLPFTNHKIELKKGDTIYLFTDGFADQFGGPKGKKFKYKQFQELLASIQRVPLMNQEKVLLEKFEAWKGNLDQVDDVLVIGLKF